LLVPRCRDEPQGRFPGLVGESLHGEHQVSPWFGAERRRRFG